MYHSYILVTGPTNVYNIYKHEQDYEYSLRCFAVDSLMCEMFCIFGTSSDLRTSHRQCHYCHLLRDYFHSVFRYK